MLQGVADDPGSPLRVVLSLRSDFLHRVAETPAFAQTMMRGLLLLAAPDPDALREAIVGPAEKAGHRFETAAMVDAIVADLRTAAAPYPLMQFCLSTLWARGRWPATRIASSRRCHMERSGGRARCSSGS